MTLQSAPPRPERLRAFAQQAASEPAIMFALRLFERRKWTLIATLLIVPLISAAAIWRITPLYAATMTVIVEPKRINVGPVQAAFQEPLPDSSIESQIEIIKSRGIAMAAVDATGLVLKPEFNPVLRDRSTLDAVLSAPSEALRGANAALGALTGVYLLAPESGEGQSVEERTNKGEVVRRFQSALSVRAVGRSTVIEIGFTSADPELARDVANKVADVYLEHQLEERFQAMQRAANWVNSRLEKLQASTLASERQVEEFRNASGLVQGVRSDIVTEQISDLSAELINAQTALAAAKARLDQVRSFGSAGVVPEAVGSVTLGDLRRREAELAAREAELAATVGPRHPELVEARAQLARQRERVFAEVGRINASVESEVRAARARVESLQNGLESARARASQADSAEIRLRSLEREAKANQELYQTFLQRSKEISEQVDLEESDARIVSPAFTPTEPSYPNKGVLMLAAVAAALFVGLLLAYIEELLDQTLRTADEAEQAIGLPAVAMPRLSRLPVRLRLLDYVLGAPNSSFAESVQALRALLWLSDMAPQARVVAVTSTTAGDGKTTTALGLARASARRGERTVIVDCDFTSPSLFAQFGLTPAAPGLFDMLAGRAQRQDVMLQDAEIGTLHAIAAGQGGEQAGDLLRAPAMASLLRLLRSEYQLVILDLPPAGTVPDARAAAALADHTVYCVRWRSTARSAVTAGVNALIRLGVSVACIALTGVDARQMRRSAHDEAAATLARAA